MTVEIIICTRQSGFVRTFNSLTKPLNSIAFVEEFIYLIKRCEVSRSLSVYLTDVVKLLVVKLQLQFCVDMFSSKFIIFYLFY